MVSAPKSLLRASSRSLQGKNRSVHEAIQGETWLSDLSRGLDVHLIAKLTGLASLLENVNLISGQPATISWRFTSDQEYSARSAYLLQFEGAIPMDAYGLIWSAWAPGKCRFFHLDCHTGKDLDCGCLAPTRLGK